jgi:hypothetical protein
MATAHWHGRCAPGRRVLNGLSADARVTHAGRARGALRLAGTEPGTKRPGLQLETLQVSSCRATLSSPCEHTGSYTHTHTHSLEAFSASESLSYTRARALYTRAVGRKRGESVCVWEGLRAGATVFDHLFDSIFF